MRSEERKARIGGFIRYTLQDYNSQFCSGNNVNIQREYKDFTLLSVILVKCLQTTFILRPLDVFFFKFQNVKAFSLFKLNRSKTVYF